MDLVVGVLEKEIENIIAGWSSSIAYCMLYECVLYQEVMGRWERQRAGRMEEKKKGGGVTVFAISVTKVKPCNNALIHYPVQYIRGQYCTLPAESTLILHGE